MLDTAVSAGIEAIFQQMCRQHCPAALKILDLPPTTELFVAKLSSQVAMILSATRIHMEAFICYW